MPKPQPKVPVLTLPSKQKKYIERAANAFMLIQVSISKYSGIVKLPKSLREAYALEQNVASKNVKMSFEVLGQHHHHLSKVIAAFAAIRTYLYDNTLPMSQADGDQQARGDRLVAVTRVPEVITKLGKLERLALDALAGFLSNYDTYVRTANLGLIRKHIKHLSLDEVGRRFNISISPPKLIPVLDMARYGSLPADLAQKIADANARELATQLDCAKNAAVKGAETVMKTVVEQLTVGKRLSPSLITNATHAAKMLRDMTRGYDSDPRLLEFADMIDNKIGNIKDTSVWKDKPKKKAGSLAAAKKVLSQIDRIRKADEKVAKLAADKSDSNLTPIGGGMLADLLS